MEIARQLLALPFDGPIKRVRSEWRRTTRAVRGSIQTITKFLTEKGKIEKVHING